MKSILLEAMLLHLDQIASDAKICLTKKEQAKLLKAVERLERKILKEKEPKND